MLTLKNHVCFRFSLHAHGFRLAGFSKLSSQTQQFSKYEAKFFLKYK